MGADGGLMEGSNSNVDVPRLTAIMSNYQSRKEEWEQYAFFDPYRYTVSLLHFKPSIYSF
jgi:hypothetical protein